MANRLSSFWANWKSEEISQLFQHMLLHFLVSRMWKSRSKLSLFAHSPPSLAGLLPHLLCLALLFNIFLFHLSLCSSPSPPHHRLVSSRLPWRIGALSHWSVHVKRPVSSAPMYVCVYISYTRINMYNTFAYATVVVAVAVPVSFGKFMKNWN